MLRLRTALQLALAMVGTGCEGSVLPSECLENCNEQPLTGGDAGAVPAGPHTSNTPEGGSPWLASDAGVVQLPDGAVLLPGGGVLLMDGAVLLPDGAVLPGSDAGGVSVDAGPSTQPTAENPCGQGAPPITSDLRIRELALYQTVKVPLYKSGTWVAQRNAGLIQRKKSLLRVFVEPLTGFAPRTLRAVLTLQNAGTAKTFTADRAVSKASTDEAVDSTFEFPLDPSAIGGDTQLSVSLIETQCVQGKSAAPGARIPDSGLTALNAGAVGKLNVVLVPVNLGNGVVPDTSSAQIARIRDALLAYYPVAEVNVSARAAVSWTQSVTAAGGGWDTLLDKIGATRNADRAAKDVYYFGLITPAASFSQYCRTSCVLGLAPLVSFVSAPNQIGLGIGYPDENTLTTIIHELGHAHGLPHAPCVRGGSIEGPDPKFPYAGGKIGSWGWDSRSAKLMAPTTYADVMGYCSPSWISDYNYEKLAARSRSVNTAALLGGDKALTNNVWRRIIISADGSMRWGAELRDEQPGGLTWARALNTAGQVVAEVQVASAPLPHTGGSFLYVPALDASWAALDVGGRRVDLAHVQPAL